MHTQKSASPSFGAQQRESAFSKVVSDPWRRVVFLALAPLLVGSALTYAFRSTTSVWLEIGTGLIGGSVIGLVFALVQHTLDEKAGRREADESLRFTVSSSQSLDGIDLRNRDLEETYLRGKHFDGAVLSDASFDGSDLLGSVLTGANLRGASFRGSQLCDAHLTGSDLDHADCTGADLRRAHIGRTRFVDAHLVEANLADVTDAEGAVFCRARLDRADLTGAVLDGVSAPFASGVGLNARGVWLRGADLSCSDLRRACFVGAHLDGTDFVGADLRGVLFEGASLKGARLCGARLDGADFTGAIFDEHTDLDRADMSSVHLGPAGLEGVPVRPTVPPRSGESRSVGGAVDGGADGEEVLAGSTVFVSLSGTTEMQRLFPGLLDGAVRAYRARRDRLAGIGEDPLRLSSDDLPPDWGDLDDWGLGGRLARRLPRVLADAVVNVSTDGTQLTVSLEAERTGLGRAFGATRLGPKRLPELREKNPVHLDGATVTAERVATAVQLLLAAPSGFTTVAALELANEMLDATPLRSARHRAEIAAALEIEPDNRVLLYLQCFISDGTDIELMHRIVDQARVAWSESDSPVRRAMLASRLARARCQVLHRADVDDSLDQQEKARAAADAAISLLLAPGEPRGRRERRRQLGLLARATYAASFADSALETDQGLESAIERLVGFIEELERNRLIVTPNMRNTVGYQSMTLAGRESKGPRSDLYDRARREFDAVLGVYGIRSIGWLGDTDRAWLCSAIHTVDPSRGPATGATGTTQGAGVTGEVRCRDQDGHFVEATTGWDRSRIDAAIAEYGDRPLRMALANRGNLFRIDKQWPQALVCYDLVIQLDAGYIEGMAERACVAAEMPGPLPGRDPVAQLEADVDAVFAATQRPVSQRSKVLLLVCAALLRTRQFDLADALSGRVSELHPDSRRVSEFRRCLADRDMNGGPEPSGPEPSGPEPVSPEPAKGLEVQQSSEIQ